MRIQHNIMAMNAYRNYNTNTSALAKNLEKLSSGYKINRAGDDAAGLAISEKMRAQITGLNAAQKNVKDGISLVKTAEGAMQEIHDMLNRMDYLATQSANGTYDNEVDRLNLQKEVDSLKREINRIADSANFNGIKLMDGSLSTSTEKISAGSESAIIDGISITETKPGGTNGTYSIDLNNTFGAGSTLKLTLGTGDPQNKKVSDLTSIDTTTPPADANKGEITLTYGTDFSGATKEEQAASIAEFLNTKSDLAAEFDITSNGSAVVLTNKNEGNKEYTITAADITDTNNIETANAWTNAQLNSAGAAGTASEIEFADIFDATNGYDLADGDKLTLSFEDSLGNTWKTSVTVELGASDAATHNNILNALKVATFEDVEGTLGDESSKKLSDLFTITLEDGTADNNGKFNLKLVGKANAGSEIFAGKGATVSLERADGTAVAGGGFTSTVTEGTGVAGTAADWKAGLVTTTEPNFSVGDKMTIAGTLSDGSAFEVTLEAGKDFELDETSYGTTLNNIMNVLAGTRGYGDGLDVTVGKGTDKERTVSSKDLFDTTGTDSEIKIEVNATDGNLEFTSNVESSALNSKVTGVTVKAAPKATSTNLFVNGNQQTGASKNITFKDGEVAEGATVKIDGKTYEFTTSGELANPDSGNIAVKVDDLNSGAALASALKDAVQAQIQGAVDAGTNTYTVGVATTDPNTVVVTTKAVGTAADYIEVDAANAGTQTALELELDATRFSNGTRVTIEGQTYEFVSKDSRSTKNTDGTEKYIPVVVAGMSEGKATSVDFANALKAAVDANPNKGSIDMSVDADSGKITIVGTDNSNQVDGSYVFNKPQDVTIEYNGGLTLQIGDTSDKFNQMSVAVGDMHTKAMGTGETTLDGKKIKVTDTIDDISIANQEDAQDAIAVIKNAINYVSGVRGDLGAIQNRLEHTQNNLSVMAENIQDAESTIRDTDVAEEMMAYTKNNILIQSAQAMLAQANAVPQGVLQLLG